MLRIIILALALSALWLLLSGQVSIDEINEIASGHVEGFPIVLGFWGASIAICLFFAARAKVLDDEGVPLSLMPGVFAYWLWLLVEIGKSNIIVARQALAIRPKLSPKMISVPADQISNAGRATFANSITLTPGTVSVDLHKNEILVHALTEDLADVGALRDMGRKVCRIEGKPRPGSGEAA